MVSIQNRASRVNRLTLGLALVTLVASAGAGPARAGTPVAGFSDTLAVGSLEHKFWRAACEVLERPQWADRHWQRGLMPNSPESNALRDEVAALVASRPLVHWAERFERADACVTPVLTLEEAQRHELFAASPRHPWLA